MGLLLPLAVLALIVALLIRRVWMRFRVVAVAIPGTDLQALRYKLAEYLRSNGFRPEPESVPTARYRAPAWMKWVVGLQDIRVEPTGNGGLLVTGPALQVSRIGRHWAGASRQQYQGPQPVWPLVKGCLRIFGIGVILVAGLIAALLFFVPR